MNTTDLHTMKTHRTTLDRRTVLETIAVGGIGSLAGCNERSPLEAVGVDGQEIVVSISEDASITELLVVQPDGEHYASKQVSSGVTQVTVPVDIPYPPGEYELRALDADEVVDRESITLRPELQITDLKLARNHPNEMYDGAGANRIRTEPILTVSNRGTGPEEVVQLRFGGDVPNPTPEDTDDTGIIDPAGVRDRGGDTITVSPNEDRTVYSYLLPFASVGENVRCTPDGYAGRFTVEVTGRIGGSVSEEYNVEYTGETLSNCDISVSEYEQ